MKNTLLLFAIILLAASGIIRAQDSSAVVMQNTDENKLKISGELSTDERFLLKNQNNWAWNETRLALKPGLKITDRSKFYSEVWLRNIGLPNAVKSSDLYNKGIVDPINIEIREAYVQVIGFLTKNLDLKIGRQRITWGTADKLNPTDNLNPYDLEDILDFGRHRGSDAINLIYYPIPELSLQGIYIPFFRPVNMPVGIFANALNPSMELPLGMTLKETSDTLLTPKYNLKESSSAAFKLQCMVKGVDFSFSYIWGHDGLPIVTRNTFIPVDTLGGVNIRSQLSYTREHIFGFDLSTSFAGLGFWTEASLTLPEKNVVMSTDLSALYPLSPEPVIIDSTLLKKSSPYLKFIIGCDYIFKEGSYLNFQYLHGFFHERGNDNMNDYFFLRYEKKFFNDKLCIAPVSGAFIVSDWKKVKNNYAIAYIPQVSYKATDDVEIALSAAFFDGKGDNMFANLSDYNMFMFKLKYDF